MRYLEASAELSPCGKYRYLLRRRWGHDSANRVLLVMLNPSTANGEKDDPTIRACVSFAHSWGFDELEVVNLFALRATNPDVLDRVSCDLVGPQNDEAIAYAAIRAKQIVCAWGVRGAVYKRASEVISMLTEHGDIFQIRATKAKAPEHPLYLPRDLKPVPFVNSKLLFQRQA